MTWSHSTDFFVRMPSGTWVRASLVSAVGESDQQPGRVSVYLSGGLIVDGGEADSREVVRLICSPTAEQMESS